VAQRTIVVIEDEAAIASAIAARLTSEGFRVVVADDGPSGVEVCRREQPDLVVLDLMLPGLDGLEVCRRVQAQRPTAVLMLTAKDAETDMLIGLAVGADDYLTKPFSPRELVARINAILRRVVRTREAAGTVLRVGPIEVDQSTRRVRVGDGEVHLTPIEFDLLVHLAGRPGVVHTRDQLLAEVWGYHDGAGARTVDSHVRALRRKLGDGLIRTVHGVGYALEAG